MIKNSLISRVFGKTNDSTVVELKAQVDALRKELTDSDLDEYLSVRGQAFSKGIDDDFFGDVGQSLNYHGGINQDISIGTLQRVMVSESWFFIAVAAISGAIAGLPIKVERRKVTSERVSDSMTVRVEHWVDASGEPEQQLLAFPNDIQTAVEFYTLLGMDLMGTGNAYIYMDAGDGSRDVERPAFKLLPEIYAPSSRKTGIKGMYRINPAFIEPKLSKDKLRVLGYRLTSPGGAFSFERDEIIHIRLPNPIDCYVGLSPIVPVFKSVLLDRYSTEHMIRFYKQGARLGGVIKSSRKLSKEQLTRLQRSFEQDFTGKHNHHRTLILPEGMEYTTIEQNPGETALLEFVKANREPILAAYRVPPVMVALMDGATYANALTQEKAFWSNAVKPMLAFIEQSLNMHPSLMPESAGLRMRFDLSGVEALQEDEVAKGNKASAGLNAGLTINEVRQRYYQLDPIAGGDICPAIEKYKAPAAPAMPFLLAAPAAPVKEKGENLPQNDAAIIASDIKPTDATFEQRVAQIVAILVAQGVDVAIATQRAVEQAQQEGFSPKPPETAAEKPTDSQEPVAPPAETTNDTGKSDVQPLPSNPGVRFPEEALNVAWKAVMNPEQLAKFVAMREAEVKAIFADMRTLFLSNAKGRNPAITTKGISDDDITAFAKAQSKEAPASYKQASEYGFQKSMITFKLKYPDEDANARLASHAGRNIKYITESTQKHIQAVIAKLGQENAPVGEIRKTIDAYFSGELSERGFDPETRAQTIARTETLSALSIGQDIKGKTFQKEFPDKAKQLKKIWITAKDERVRGNPSGMYPDAEDNHHALEGEIVDADAKFSNGLEFPRDPSGEAEQTINCRCTHMQFLPEDKDLISEIVDEPSPAANVDEGAKS